MTNTTFQSFLKTIRWNVREYVSVRPKLWRFSTILRGSSHNIIGAQTDIVCEGYPRSGNSFAEAVFHITQGPLKIAHHRHVPAQLLLAEKMGKPALLLYRSPKDAVASAVLRRKGETTLGRELETWINFNRACLPIADTIVTVGFPTTTQHFKLVIAALNKKYNINLAIPKITNEALGELAFCEISRLAKARNKDAHLNYGSNLSAEVRAARTASLDALKADLERNHAGRLAVAHAIHDRLEMTSVLPQVSVGDV